MVRAVCSLLIVGCFIVATTYADDAKDEAIKKDRKWIKGTWRVVALEVNGNKAMDEDAKKLSVVNGSDGTWTLYSEGKEISKGTSAFDPTKKPKTIDFTPTEGEGKGNKYLGIYELGEKTRKMCFAPPGKDRPTEFSSVPGSEIILVTFEREKGRLGRMDGFTEGGGYSHTQKAPLCLILYGSALLCFGLAWIVGDTAGIFIAGAVGLVIALLAPCFHHLAVVDQGDRLAIRFGPMPLFRRTVQHADIEKAEVGRTLILDGWGIHYSIRGGWVWNLWGFDCVVVRFKKGGVLRIGTDDAENLVRFLEGKIGG